MRTTRVLFAGAMLASMIWGAAPATAQHKLTNAVCSSFGIITVYDFQGGPIDRINALREQNYYTFTDHTVTCTGTVNGERVVATPFNMQDAGYTTGITASGEDCNEGRQDPLQPIPNGTFENPTVGTFYHEVKFRRLGAFAYAWGGVFSDAARTLQIGNWETYVVATPEPDPIGQGSGCGGTDETKGIYRVRVDGPIILTDHTVSPVGDRLP